MANVTYTVKWGDTLSEIAVKYDTTVNNLVKLNNIKDPDYIVVGQVLIISGTAATVKRNNSNAAVVDHFGLQSNTDRTVYATWRWDRSSTENYEVKWTYATGDGVAFIGNKSTTEDKQSLYTAPENATHVSFCVKPIAAKITRTRRGNTTEYIPWTASWSTAKTYYFKNNPPSVPDVPALSIDQYQLTATLENIKVEENQKNITYIEFQVIQDDTKSYIKTRVPIKTTSASISNVVAAGHKYKVRCRAIDSNNRYSDWSAYSANSDTPPASVKSTFTLKTQTDKSVVVSWSAVKNAKSYDIEYTTKKEYFDSSSETQTMNVDSVTTTAIITGLETGKEWFFRIRALNDTGYSYWTSIKSVVVGTKPAAPTTWSSTTTVVTGNPLTLYWVHNSEDGSSQTYAELEIIVDGVKEIHTIENSTDEEEKDKTSFYRVDTFDYPEGTKLEWRVRTRGVLNEYGDWSVQRTVDIYAPPTLGLSVTDSSGEPVHILTSLPLYIAGDAGPDTQQPIGYWLKVISNDTYETVDNVGSPKIVNIGEEVYSKYFDISTQLMAELSANNISLENNMDYTIKCTVSMNSGLTAESSYEFSVGWTEEEYWPNAEIAYDNSTYTAFIRPYCDDELGSLIEGITLSVYRREFDGSFTELATGIDSTSNTFITDPHPSLDFARYRIVAKKNDTGKVSYYDVPGYPIEEKAIIIQWDEEWSNFDTTIEEEPVVPPWSGSLLRLPYNIDVSDKYDPDVEHVEYIGRKHPVSYYGTQLGQSSTWNTDIDKTDVDTIYALRRLATWSGDVYVREPSGTGYWANINVSFGQKHLDVTIPVTFEIKRVEGGI